MQWNIPYELHEAFEYECNTYQNSDDTARAGTTFALVWDRMLFADEIISRHNQSDQKQEDCTGKGYSYHN